jgi:hypothetical protein
MSYVYAKVSSDPHSHQTPAFGYIEGDGDLIFEAPILKTLTASQELDEDLLVKVPPTIGSNTAPAGALVPAVEKLLSDPAPHIELHNLGVERARRFAFETSSGKLPTQGVPFSDQELARRLQLYEREARDLEALCVCIAHWGAIQDLAILQKVLARATDELSPRDGLRAWNCLRWHPVLILTYAAGIAALAARRLDSLFALFDASAQSPETPGKRTSLLDATGEAVLEIERLKLFKRLPGHERQYVPRSEYMHKLLQPDLDEILFLGAEYEDRFDEFEVVLALAHADMRAARGDRAWGPIGRFGWKAHHPMGHPDPLSVVIERERQSKEFVKAGFFGRDPKRLEAAASWLMKAVEDLGWF